MYQQKEKELSYWLSVNNQPASYMDEKWWENLGIKHLLLLLKSNNHPLLHIKINQHLVEKMELSPVPCYFDLGNDEHQFWLNYFFVLKRAALIIGLLLQDKPKLILMFNKVYSHIAKVLPIKKIRFVVANSQFIAGQVVAFSKKHFTEEKEASVNEIETQGKIILTNAAPSELTSRINLLFPPELTEEMPVKIDIDYNQRTQIQDLIKRLVRLCNMSVKNTNP